MDFPQGAEKGLVAEMAVVDQEVECEVIYVAADSIRIERGRYGPRERWVMGRTWARVVLKVCPRQWYPSRLLIRAHGRTVEIGRFLVEEEREKLARDLTQCLCVNL